MTKKQKQWMKEIFNEATADMILDHIQREMPRDARFEAAVAHFDQRISALDAEEKISKRNYKFLMENSLVLYIQAFDHFKDELGPQISVQA